MLQCNLIIVSEIVAIILVGHKNILVTYKLLEFSTLLS